MGFKKGDKVRFLNDVGGGTVTRLMGKNMVMVLNEDDFEIPVLAKELVKISSMEEEVYQAKESYSNRRETTSNSYEEEMEEEFFEEPNVEDFTIIEGNDELSLYLAILPEAGQELEDSRFKLYLINDSNYQIKALVSEREQDASNFVSFIDLDSNTKCFVKYLKRDELNDFPKLNFQFLFYGFGSFQPLKPLDKDVEIKPMKFYKKHNFVENEYFEEPAMLIAFHEDLLNSKYDEITREDILNAKKEKEKAEEEAKRLNNKYKVSKKAEEMVEVDLHIHELVDEPKGLSNKEMLDIQMSHFHSTLAEGLKNHHTKKMVFIHGIGAGVLKTELRRALKHDYPQLYFQDASFKEYGFGATLVIIRR